MIYANAASLLYIEDIRVPVHGNFYYSINLLIKVTLCTTFPNMIYNRTAL